MFRDLDIVCVVCHRSLGPDPARLMGRAFCDEHLERLTENRAGLWRSMVQFGLALLLMIVLVTVLFGVIGLPLSSDARTGLSFFLAVLPGLTWLVLVYRLEKDPGDLIQFAPTVIVLGGLAAAAIAQPFLHQLIRIDEWLPTTGATARFVSHILLIGSTHMFLIYAIMRYTVMRTPVIERRVDAILYTLITSIGYASMLNIQLVVARGGLDPTNGFLRMAGDVIGHGGAAILLGFFLGRHRFEDVPFWYVPSGLAGAMFMDGLILYSRAEINRTGLSLTQDGFSPWPGLAITLVIVGLVTAAIYGLTNRMNLLTRARLGLET